MSHGPGDVPLLDYVINVGVALVGAAVRFLREWRTNFQEWSKTRVLFEGMFNAITAGFCGLLVFWVLSSFNVNSFYIAFAAGVIGHAGPEGIALLTEIVSNGLKSYSTPPTKK